MARKLWTAAATLPLALRDKYGPNALVRKAHTDVVRDPTKDQSIVTLYLLCVLGLLLWAMFRNHFFQNLLGRLRQMTQILTR